MSGYDGAIIVWLHSWPIRGAAIIGGDLLF
jgi:hypothetical protein